MIPSKFVVGCLVTHNALATAFFIAYFITYLECQLPSFKLAQISIKILWKKRSQSEGGFDV